MLLEFCQQLGIDSILKHGYLFSGSFSLIPTMTSAIVSYFTQAANAYIDRKLPTPKVVTNHHSMAGLLLRSARNSDPDTTQLPQIFFQLGH